MTEDEMVGWHHRLNGHEFEQTQGDSEGQGSLACSPPVRLPSCSIYDGPPTTVARLMALPDKPSPETTVLWAAAAAAKSLQSCPTLCNPIDGSPPGSPIPGILQARTLEWVAISFSNA